MLSRLFRCAVVAALAGALGLHWTLWQAVAWTSMVASYSRQVPLTEAISKTFDGRHPCKLCHHISESKRAEKKSVASFDLKKLEFPYVRVAFIFQPPAAFWEVRAYDTLSAGLTHAPPLPPPRQSLA